jgi:hypothetical protein
MANAFTVLWTNDYCQWLKRCGDEGKNISVMFGGVHQSVPSLKRVGIVHGDQVFPVRILKGQLYIIARLTAGKFISLEEYSVEHLNLPVQDAVGLYDFQVIQLIQGRWPDLGHRIPRGCGIDVLIGSSGSAIRFDLIVPPVVLEALSFCSRKTRKKLKHVENGILKRSISLQGNVRRLCPESASDFNQLVDEQNENII